MNRPTPPDTGLPPDVAEALQQGRLIEAIKRLSAHGSGGLKEAKAQIDRVRRQQARAAAPARAPTPGTGFDDEGDDWGAPAPAPASLSGLPTDVIDALQRGRKLEAVKRLRTATGMGLAQARDVIEQAMSQGQHLTRALDGRSPGEVPRSDNLWWMAAVAALLAVAAWQWWIRG